MITNIVLENFKGFERVSIQPKRITAFVGPNGTGKSSVLQAFGLLKQTLEGSSRVNPLGLVLQGPLVNLPGLEALKSDFGQDAPIFRFGSVTKAQWGHGFPYEIEFPTKQSPTTRTLLAPDPEAAKSVIRGLKLVPARRGFSDPAHPLRDNPVKDVSLMTGIVEQEEQIATNLCYSPDDVEQQVAHLLKKVTGTGLRADIIPSKSVEVKSLNKAGNFNIVAEGFGTNSLIMLLLQLVSAERGATVMIEEPEIHLHPKAQADLAEVLAAEARAGDKQVIMTTHSEHITGRLLTLVAEKTLTPDDLAIYAFEKDGETGVCSAKPLQISEDGGVEGGVRDFFDTNLAEMNRFVEAQFAKLNSSE